MNTKPQKNTPRNTPRNTREPAKTKDRILTYLKQDGPQEAPELAARLNITDMAVRQHLYELQNQELVAPITRPRPKGRPGKAWSLTEKANRHFPDSHADFALGLIQSIRTAFGEEGMNRLLDLRAEEQTAEYRRQLEKQPTLRERLDHLARIRSREGYMAEVLPAEKEGEYLLVENHCPVCEAARECSGICARELLVFRQVLGAEVEIKRMEHIIEGARRCAYLVRPVRNRPPK
tara:strand:- start:6102 stop:6803 length:702 start_codon:yes stop_codon:yes gene_type:complete